MRYAIVLTWFYILSGILAAQNCVYDWTGYYVGLFAGPIFGKARSDTDVSFNPDGYFAETSIIDVTNASSIRFSSWGFTGGITGGFNFHTSANIIFGLETDYGMFLLKDRFRVTREYTDFPGDFFTVRKRFHTDWFYTLRPRAGLACGRMFFYATGGLALTEINYEEEFTDTFGGFEEVRFYHIRPGWTVGAGVEKSWSYWISTKLEYLYADFGTISKETRLLEPVVPDPNLFAHIIHLRTHSLRLGMNFRI